jgi:hypothetical protein
MNNTWTVKPNSCRCHAETCSHWDYYITDGEDILGGADNREAMQFLCDKLNGVKNAQTTS